MKRITECCSCMFVIARKHLDSIYIYRNRLVEDNIAQKQKESKEENEVFVFGYVSSNCDRTKL